MRSRSTRRCTDQLRRRLSAADLDRWNFTLRPADESDLPFLLDLRLETMHPIHVASGATLSRDEHMERVLKRFECAEIIVVEGRACGLLKLNRNDAEWHLMQIQVVPQLQGTGLGTEVLSQTIHEARAAGASIRLGVLKVNPARRLYERLGFVVFGESPRGVKMRFTPGQNTAPPDPSVGRTLAAANARRRQAVRRNTARTS